MTESSCHKIIIPDWDIQVNVFLHKNDYASVVQVYEKLIEDNPSQISHYCYMGLAYLLGHQEDLAQITWLTLLSEFDSESSMVELLSCILDHEAKRNFDLGYIENSWIIRQYLTEIDPNNIENILLLIVDSISINKFDSEDIEKINSLITNANNNPVDIDLIRWVGEKLSTLCEPLTFDCFVLLSNRINNLSLRWSFLMTNASKINKKDSGFAAHIAELCKSFYPEDPRTWIAISYFNSKARKYLECIQASKNGYLNSKSAGWKAVSAYTLTRELMLSGTWLEVEDFMESYKSCLSELIQKGIEPEDKNAIDAIISTPCLLQYFQDNPEENRFFQNKISEIYQKKISNSIKQNIYDSQVSIKLGLNQKIKVGFIAHTLTSHSVGWLFRWYCKYFNSEKFDVSLFLISQNKDDFFASKWFKSDQFNTFFCEENYLEVLDLIKSQNIQILVDLDSTTLQETCKVLAHKSAPVQITWLGFDATGLPSVDYFLSDHYVLPEDAQKYYQEKIYRLPQTYIAVDGFEVGTPTLRREDLSISSDAIVFLTSQTGLKRNPNFARVQLKILKLVPNSYLLIKGSGDSQKIHDLFCDLAVEIGVSKNQLRFLSFDSSEFSHRANLQIADIVLDTYPYNGATTTLEALWMCIPVVTRVGQQFSSRNGYAFLTQVGVTEGIATTDDEYIEWGIRLGTNEHLRQKVFCQLRASQTYSPLWNAKQFAKELEYAFEDIWEKYLQSIH